MSKNSSNSSDSPFKFEQLSEEISDWESNRREELYQIFQREEFKKFALANGFDASREFDDESFCKFGVMISSDKALYNNIAEVISERIEEVMKIEEFTEEELEILDESLDGKKASKSEEGELPDAQLTDKNLEPFRKIVGRERYYDTDEILFKKIKQKIATADKSETTALSKIFTRFLNEFNEDLNGDDCDIFSPELYKDLMRRQQAFIAEALTLLELDIRQKVIIDALKQSKSNLHLQENFKELISKPLSDLGYSEVMTFLENQEEGNLTQSSAKSSGVKCATAVKLQVVRARPFSSFK